MPLGEACEDTDSAGGGAFEHLSPLLSPAFFVVDGYIGLGVPIGTDAFIQHFVKDKCQAIVVRRLWRTLTSSTTSKMAITNAVSGLARTRV
jgi:hypothetical protein